MISMKDEIFPYDKIVIGYKSNAILYAYLQGYPIVINDSFQYLPCDQISDFIADRNDLLQNKLGGDLSLFQNISDILANILFDMSLHGLLISYQINKITILPDRRFLLLSQKDKTTIKISYNKIILFDDENILGLPQGEEKFSRYQKEVIDCFDCSLNNFTKAIDQGSLLCQDRKLWFKYKTNDIPEEYEVRLMLSNLLETDLSFAKRYIRDPKKIVYRNIPGVTSYE